MQDAPGSAVRFVDTQASVLLDVVRGLAALLVLFDHWRTLLFVDYGQVATHRLLLAPVYIVAASGHQAVVIFFVLSGYLIGGSVFRMLANDAWSWKAYLTHRLLRLWIVLLPALLLGLLWDRVGLRLNLAPILYSGMGHGQQIPDVRVALSPAVFFGNALFLQTIKVPVFGANGPLWSLANEFWYYILFPLGLLAMRRRQSLGWRIVYGALLVAVAFFVGRNILVGLGIWLFGALLARARAPNLAARTRWLAAALYAPLVFALPKIGTGHEIASDYLLGVATFLLLWVFLSAGRAAEPRAREVRAARAMARFSFTLYLTHVPLMVLLTSVWQGDGRYQPSPQRLAVGLGMLGVALLFAWLVAAGTEFQTDRVRGWVERRLGRNKASAAPKTSAFS
jgi:peptidoglycan/LPS O-acetylase OafA/YrhL